MAVEIAVNAASIVVRGAGGVCTLHSFPVRRQSDSQPGNAFGRPAGCRMPARCFFCPCNYLVFAAPRCKAANAMPVVSG